MPGLVLTPGLGSHERNKRPGDNLRQYGKSVQSCPKLAFLPHSKFYFMKTLSMSRQLMIAAHANMGTVVHNIFVRGKHCVNHSDVFSSCIRWISIKAKNKTVFEKVSLATTVEGTSREFFERVVCTKFQSTMYIFSITYLDFSNSLMVPKQAQGT